MIVAIGNYAYDWEKGHPAEERTFEEAVLVAKELVRRLPDPDNARAVRVVLTDAGRAMLGQMPDGFDAVVDMLSDADAGTLHGIVISTIVRLQQAGRIAPQRLCVTCRYFVSEADGAGGHFCSLVNQPLQPADLRVNCPEHEATG